MQSEMEKSSSLSALRQRVRDGVDESDFAGLADGAFAAGRHFLLVGVFVHSTGRRVGPRRRRGVPVQIRLGRTAGEIRVGVYL